jgi:hypothetical protein
MQPRLLDNLISYLFKYPLPAPRRIRHEMLQRLPVGIFHATLNPRKYPITFHRYLAPHIRQGMLAGVARSSARFYHNLG